MNSSKSIVRRVLIEYVYRMNFYRRNSDAQLRELERMFNSSPTLALFRQLEAMYRRMGVTLMVPYQNLLSSDIWDEAHSQAFNFYDFINGPIVPQLCGCLLAACFDLLEEVDPSWTEEIMIWDDSCGEIPEWNLPDECFRSLTKTESTAVQQNWRDFISSLMHLDFHNQNTSGLFLKKKILSSGDKIRSFLRRTKLPSHLHFSNWRELRSALSDIIYNLRPHSHEYEGREASIFEGHARFTLILRKIHILFENYQKELFTYLEPYLFNSLISLRNDTYQWTVGLMLFTESNYGVRDTFPDEHSRVMGILQDLQEGQPDIGVDVIDLNFYHIDFPEMPIIDFQETLASLIQAVEEDQLVEWSYLWKPRVIIEDPSAVSSRYF